MPAPLTNRTWDATITIGDETFAAEPSSWDTLREVQAAVLHECAEMIRAGLGNEARITLYKTTQARGRERDRSGWVGYDGARYDGARVVGMWF